MKNSRGEISIQMVVTVIVLIIMVGIFIFMLTGENGIFVPNEEKEIVQNGNNIINTEEEQDELNNKNETITVTLE